MDNNQNQGHGHDHPSSGPSSVFMNHEFPETTATRGCGNGNGSGGMEGNSQNIYPDSSAGVAAGGNSQAVYHEDGGGGGNEGSSRIIHPEGNVGFDGNGRTMYPEGRGGDNEGNGRNVYSDGGYNGPGGGNDGSAGARNMYLEGGGNDFTMRNLSIISNSNAGSRCNSRSSSFVSESSNGTHNSSYNGQYLYNNDDEFSSYGGGADDVSSVSSVTTPTLMFKVQFKSTTDDFYLSDCCPRDIAIGDCVKVEADRGHDVGMVCDVFWPSPEEVRAVCATNNKKILGLASSDELLLSKGKSRDEARALAICKDVIATRNMPVTLVDAEYQYDRKKLTFFFTSDGHTDFRELVRDLFTIFKTRIWMQKIKPFEAAAFRNANSPIPRFNGGGSTSMKGKSTPPGSPGQSRNGYSNGRGHGHSQNNQAHPQGNQNSYQGSPGRSHRHSHGSSQSGHGTYFQQGPGTHTPPPGGGGSDTYRSRVHHHAKHTSSSQDLLKQATHHATQFRYLPRSENAKGNSHTQHQHQHQHQYNQNPPSHHGGNSKMHHQHLQDSPQQPIPHHQQYSQSRQQSQLQFHHNQDPYSQHPSNCSPGNISPYTSYSSYADRLSSRQPGYEYVPPHMLPPPPQDMMSRGSYTGSPLNFTDSPSNYSVSSDRYMDSPASTSNYGSDTDTASIQSGNVTLPPVASGMTETEPDLSMR